MTLIKLAAALVLSAIPTLSLSACDDEKCTVQTCRWANRVTGDVEHIYIVRNSDDLVVNEVSGPANGNGVWTFHHGEAGWDNYISQIGARAAAAKAVGLYP